MPYRSFSFENVFFVRWNQVLLRDMDELMPAIRLAKARQPRPIIYAGIQFDDYIDPDPEVRKAILPKARELSALVGWYYIAICSTGVRSTLQRSLLRAVLTGARAAGYDVSVVRVIDSVDALLKERERDLPCSIAELKSKLDAAGMLR